MFDVIYENEKGRLHFTGGGRRHRERELLLKAVAGLGLPNKEYNVTGFAGQAGQELIAEKDMARVITLSFDLCARGGLQQALRHVLEVLYAPGVLTVASRGMQRKIACRCSGVEEPERHSEGIWGMVVQFTCDIPYFTGSETEQKTLFSREDLVSGSFTLPCVFTERISRRTVVNHGDVPSEPVITLHNTSAESAAALSEDYGIFIQNHSTGQHLLLLCRTSPGEVIRVDIPGRQIVSSLSGDITACISRDTFLSNFQLVPGENDLEVTNYNTEEALSVVLSYENLYVEAVM